MEIRVRQARLSLEIIPASRPELTSGSRLETGFEVGSSAQGDVIAAGVAGHASLLVRLVHGRADQPG
jgi:hypothetical protein